MADKGSRLREKRAGRGGSVAPRDPGCGLQLALARGPKMLPPALGRLVTGIECRPLGLERAASSSVSISGNQTWGCGEDP